MSESSYWNHRVVRVNDAGTESGKYLIVQEVFYRDNKPFMRTIDGAKPGGETIEQIRTSLQNMLKSLDQCILDDTDFPPEK